MYSEESYAALQVAIEEAEDVLISYETETQEDIDEAYSHLELAIERLEQLSPKNYVNLKTVWL